MRSFTIFLSILVFFSCNFLSLSAQRVCHTMETLEQEVRENPDRLNNLNRLEKYTQAYHPLADAKGLITIPVVIHVVYNGEGQNISDAQILSQLETLNQDFRRTNSDADNAWTQAADTEIEFCLASIDPQGNATTGIVRTPTTVSGFGTNNTVKFTSAGGSDAWPASDYLNIWVCNIGRGILGYAQFPGGSPLTDGVVNDYRYFGSIGTATAPFNLGRTLTHEVGHYLNLRHIWGDGDCSTDDFVEDTPQASHSHGGCQIGATSCNSLDMVQNYMDYSNDACMNLFTQGQRNRMRAALAGPRASLLASNGCGAAGTESQISEKCEGTEIGFTLITDNYGSETSWTLTGPMGLVAAGDNYASNISINETFCLPDGCYTFTINDSYGDGICCTYGNGFYALSGGGVNILGGVFQDSETREFCIKSGNPLPPACDDGIQNGTETGVDCGGRCRPCEVIPDTCAITYLNTERFETGYGIWADGGADCVRSRTRAIDGDRSVYLRSNTSTSVLTSQSMDLSSVNQVEVSFSFRAYSIEAGEELLFQIDSGNGFETIANWVGGEDFENNVVYQKSVTIEAPLGVTAFRFRGNASSNADYFHLDNIMIGVCLAEGATMESVAISKRNTATASTEEEQEANYLPYYDIFPNPASEAFTLTIDTEGYTASLSGIDGRIITTRALVVGRNHFQTSALPSGMYLMIVEGKDYRNVEKVVIK